LVLIFLREEGEREIFCGIDDGAIKGFTVEGFRFVVIRVVLFRVITDEAVKGMGEEGEERDKEAEEAEVVVVIG